MADSETGLRLPAYGDSYAVLIGTGTYQDPHLENLGAALRNIDGLAAALIDPSIGGWPGDRVVRVADPSSFVRLGSDLAELCSKATDTLLIYYAGHGLLSTNSELYLTVTSSSSPSPTNWVQHSAMPYQWVRDAARTSPAANILLILDCCFSGRAIDIMSDEDNYIADHVDVEGTFTLTSTTRNHAAKAPAGQTYTAFTAELLDILTNGIPSGQPYLTARTIYQHLDRRLSAKGLPKPQGRGVNTIDRLIVARNVSAERSFRDSEAVAPPVSAGFNGGLAQRIEHAIRHVESDPRCSAALLAWLTDNEATTRATAAEQLADAAIGQDPDQSAAIRRFISEAVYRPALREELLRRLDRDRRSDVRVAAAQGLAEVATDPAVLKDLLPRLADNDAPVRGAVAEALAGAVSSPEVRKALLARLTSDEESRVRARAARALEGAMEDPAVREVLTTALEGERADVQAAAAASLANAMTTPELDWEVRFRLSSAVTHPLTQESLLVRLQDGKSEVRQVAASVLAKATDRPEVCAALLNLLTDDESRVRSAAADSLARVAADPEVWSALLAAFSDNDRMVRGVVARSLAGAAGTAEVQEALLARLIGDEDTLVRNAAARALESAVDRPAVRAALLNALTGDDDYVQLGAASSLAGSLADPDVLNAYLARLDSGDEYTRKAAADALADAVTKQAVREALQARLRSNDENVRLALLEDLRFIRDLQKAKATIETLAVAVESRDVRKKFLDLLSNPRTDAEIRIAAIEALHTVADKWTVRRALKAALSSGHARIAEAAANALRR